MTRGPRSVVVGGGLAGITAALALADAGPGHAARGAARGWAGPALLPSAAALHRRQRPARLPALLHRLPVVPRPARRRRPRAAAGPVRRPVLDARAAGRGGCAAPPAARAAAPAAGARRATRTCRSPSAARRSAPRSRCGGLDPADPALDGIRLRRAGCAATGSRPRAVEALWDLVGVATLNAAAGDASLGAGRDGLQDRPARPTPAPPTSAGPASRSATARHPARAALDRAGVRTASAPGAPVEQTRPRPEPYRHRRRTAARAADAVVLAVPHRAGAPRCCPPGALPTATGWTALGTAPILNVHVVYDRTGHRRPFFAALGSPVQWVFDRTDGRRAHRRPVPGAVACPPPTTRSTCPAAELRDRYLPELERLLPARPRAPRVLDFFVTRERTATFAQAPASARCARAPATGCPACTWPARGPPPAGPDHGGRRAQRTQRGRPPSSARHLRVRHRARRQAPT